MTFTANVIAQQCAKRDVVNNRQNVRQTHFRHFSDDNKNNNGHGLKKLCVNRPLQVAIPF